jgi:predicted transcriptional regulator
MSEPMQLTAELVAAYVSNNNVPKGDLPNLLLAVHSAISRLGTESSPAAPQVEPQQPAVTIRKSITPDYLICLEDGKKFKSLRRHLTALGLTPEQYRKKWNLPSDYPMVAPKYSAARAALARQFGLGNQRKKAR